MAIDELPVDRKVLGKLIEEEETTKAVRQQLNKRAQQVRTQNNGSHTK